MVEKRHDSTQKELFEEFEYARKWPRFLKKRQFPQRHFMLKITYERAVLSFVILTLILVITFCTGVERGKQIAVLTPQAVDTTADIAKVVNVTPPKTTQQIKEPLKPNEEKKVEKTTTWVYTVQVASYLKEEAARKELERLKRAGFNSYLTQSGKYYLLCEGNYSSKKQARSAKSRLKREYKDCFIKKKRGN